MLVFFFPCIEKFGAIYDKTWVKKKTKTTPIKHLMQHVKEELIKNTDPCKNDAACQML